MVAGHVCVWDVELKTGEVSLAGTLGRPDPAHGLVVFVHGSGSGRFSPRNRLVAEGLHRAGLATLLFDLLTPEEEQEDRITRRWRFDIPLLAHRLTGAVDWLVKEGLADSEAHTWPLGLFGASTGAAAALITAAVRPDVIQAVVCRGGRPDLAPQALPRVRCPTLFIVGGADPEVLALNQVAASTMVAPHHLAVVPGASHLFEEAGALPRVISLAREWFDEHLCRALPAA